VAVGCLKNLEELKDGGPTGGLAETIDNFKVQLGKYHQILLLELKHDQNNQNLRISAKVLKEHKSKLLRAKDDGPQPEE